MNMRNIYSSFYRTLLVSAAKADKDTRIKTLLLFPEKLARVHSNLRYGVSMKRGFRLDQPSNGSAIQMC